MLLYHAWCIIIDMYYEVIPEGKVEELTYSFDGHDCFRVLAIANDATVNMNVQIPL